MIRWGDGMEPRHLTWVLPAQLAVSECPGGYQQTRRSARLKEELIWIRKENFAAVICLIADPEITSAYQNQKIPGFEVNLADLPPPAALHQIFSEINAKLSDGQKVLVHRHGLDELVLTFTGALLLWLGRAGSAAQAEQALQQLFGLHIGIQGRQYLAGMAQWCQNNPEKRAAADSKA